MPAKDRFTEQFLEHLDIERNVSPRTLRNYRQALREFRESVPERARSELRADDFRRYLFERMKAGLAKPTIRLQIGRHTSNSSHG